MSREDGAPAGTSYKCFICGGDTRKPQAGRRYPYEGAPAQGTYVAGVGVKHKTEEECRESLNSIPYIASRTPYPLDEDPEFNF